MNSKITTAVETKKRSHLITVLLIEDNPVDARFMRDLLRLNRTRPFELIHASTFAEGQEKLRNKRFDVILTDLSLPDAQGLDAFRGVHSLAAAIPIVVLSGNEDDALAISAVREGAQDYLVKGRIDGFSLSRALIYAVERHRAEDALQESQRHFRHLLESTTDYSYTVHLEKGRPARVAHSPGCLTVTGYSPADYEKDAGLWQRIVHKKDQPAVVAQAEKVLEGKTPPSLEHRIIHKNGEVRWVRNTVVQYREEQGQVVAYEGLIADITERKRAEEQLITSEAFYHSLVENLPQNILRKDLNERFTFANRRFCTMLGKPLEEIIGKTDFDFFAHDLARKYQADDRYVIETGETFETIEENQSPNGEKIYVNVVKTPIYDAQGAIMGIQGIFWDITERKRFEERLQKANDELMQSEKALRKSHEELKSAQLQLIQAEKMESIGTLAAGVAHEVKNPLAILMMGINFLSKRLLDQDENVTLVLKEMRDAVTRADTITRGLLDFSASRQLSMTSEDMNSVISEMLRLMRHELEQKQITLVKQWGEKLPRVAIDKNQIQQVLVNVVMNAMHAMPEGGTLTVRTYGKQIAQTSHYEGSRTADHLWVGDMAVVIEVEDTGTGIPEENLAKIFDPFFTTKPTGVGTGLGLPVSKKIIELHGGTLNIRNVKGQGVRVTIVLKAQGTIH